MASLVNDTQPVYNTFSSNENDSEPAAAPETSPEDGFAEQEDKSLSNAPVEKLTLRKFILAEISFITGITIFLFASAIDQRALRLLQHPLGRLTPVFLCQFLLVLFVRDVTPEDPRKLGLRAYKNGTVLSNNHKRSWLITAAANTALICFGLFGTYIIGLKAWGRWMPDIDLDLDPDYDKINVQALLWAWFASLAAFGLLFLLLPLCIGLFALLIKSPNPPAIGPPDLPKIKDFPPPVNDCVLTYTVFNLSWIGFLIVKSGYSPVLWPSRVILVLSIAWIVRQICRRFRQVRRLQLCIDWATQVDCIEADPQALELLTERSKVLTKYIFSLAAALPAIFGTVIIAVITDKENLDNVIIMPCVYLFLTYLCLWAIWR